MPAKYDPNALWVALSENSDKDLFNVYPKLLAELFLQEEAARQDGDTSEAEKLILPSDKEWRFQQYFMLVSMQRTLILKFFKRNLICKQNGSRIPKQKRLINLEDHLDFKDPKSKIPMKTMSNEELFATPVEEEKANGPNLVEKEDSFEEWAPWNFVVATKNPRAPPPVQVKTQPGPAWDIGQVVKAGQLLRKPPFPVVFTDEQEMRCVYSLIYEVFRYKTILDQALDDVEFLGEYPKFLQHRHIVWLYLMELARRQWGARSRAEMERAKNLLNEAGPPFIEIEESIWKQRVHFAAAIARIRIKNKAFSLSDLLPPHLKEERISACVHKETVTGWVNTFKAKKVALLVKRLHDLGYTYSHSRQLCAGEYRFDRVCPRFITLRPPENEKVAQLDLVKDGIIVLQEREFCEGASTLCRALRANALRGVVVQTHASSPRCSAYLAAQLRELAGVLKAQDPPAPALPELGKLVVFGAGDKVESYVSALRDLGIEASVALHSDAHVCVLSEPVHCDTPIVANALDGVVAALATPPNSYSAVTDPIDLVCGRGGDVAMLEVLTESEVDSKGKARIQSILEEQKKTLRSLMSKPQIQLICYETHSALEAENQAQVMRAISEANRLARERHFLLKKKNRHSSPTKHVVDGTDNEPIDDDEITIDDTPDKVNIIEDGSPKKIAEKVKSRPPSEDIHKKPDGISREGSRPGTTKARPIPDLPPNEKDSFPKDPDNDSPDVFVPECDLFEVGKLPNLGNGLDIHYILDRDGCYLGIIQRKELTRLDPKFMIRVAEERGLFGQGAPAPPPQRRKKPERSSSDSKRRKRKNSFEIERVAAPTYASLTRTIRRDSAPPNLDDAALCARHARRQAAALSAITCSCDQKHRPQYRRASLGEAIKHPVVRPPSPPCRRPFPLVVQDLKLKPSLSLMALQKIIT